MGVGVRREQKLFSLVILKPPLTDDSKERGLKSQFQNLSTNRT